MVQRQHKLTRSVHLLWIIQKPEGIGSVSNKYSPSVKSGFNACISSSFSAVIHITGEHQINYNCFNEPFAVSPCKDLYWDMHGLIFETSIWLLAGSTRFLSISKHKCQCVNTSTRACVTEVIGFLRHNRILELHRGTTPGWEWISRKRRSRRDILSRRDRALGGLTFISKTCHRAAR